LKNENGIFKDICKNISIEATYRQDINFGYLLLFAFLYVEELPLEFGAK
jgi:hypothetical protein